MKLWKMRSVPKMYVKYTKIKKKSIQILLKFDQISKKKTELHGKMSKGKKNLGGGESWETSRRLRCLDSPPALRRPPGAGDGPPAPDSPEDHPGKGRHPDTLEGILVRWETFRLTASATSRKCLDKPLSWSSKVARLRARASQ